MLTMSAAKWIVLLALCFIRVSSNDEHNDEDYDEDRCETQALSAPLGSSVSLPCNLDASSEHWVTWAHSKTMDLVQVSIAGRVKFLDPRHGRVKTFPNQASEGNYSIRIDELTTSDLGSYRCYQVDYCVQVVDLSADSPLSTEMWLLTCISVGVTALILLSVGGYFCCKKCVVPCHSKTQDNESNPVSAGTEGASAPPAPSAPHGQQIGSDSNSLVYENDDQYLASAAPARRHQGHPGAVQDQPSQAASGIYPNLSEFKFERVESQRTRMRFHIELINRLRPSSLSRHYYVNQGDLRKQQAMSAQAEAHHRAGVGLKKVKEECEYKNPIYNRSTDQLNHL
ncbi:uncharacterized protein LOC103359271 isoform X2 [Stegastes partitus]|uniref:Uncharacterized protein LOC103359271 isoform X2 n=1 Tax=Stegastes partitus TaxID=144197 RepID=A0A9Y4JUH6_9TELE|nr:PREDICTED: uncharacterized protein LOC103359271 isoform X2 [Stegastes partitus]